jgi:hypothetical protein
MTFTSNSSVDFVYLFTVHVKTVSSLDDVAFKRRIISERVSNEMVVA